MYSFWQRSGTLGSFFSSGLMVVLPLIAALNFLIYRAPPKVSMEVNNVTNRLGVEDYFMNRKVMLTDLALNVDAVLEYESENYGRNQVVFWDKIIRRTDGKRLSITGLKNKYPMVDIEDRLPGTTATVKMYWNTVPQVGYLFDTQNGSVEVKIPNIGEKFSAN
ncbi:hypothetical protein PSACC_01748 [Paramicrosporidium saccamoebae]|uniref:Signal peptidase subunit 3 n=1 Tax=Paramicrosporidium saccamoebae TaxID=1246581 RepID=A0A2H9TL13_9FUNG|nr:hypothetical protein PSACC_01748 [Paramicrosporidium saccamoebae]